LLSDLSSLVASFFLGWSVALSAGAPGNVRSGGEVEQSLPVGALVFGESYALVGAVTGGCGAYGVVLDAASDVVVGTEMTRIWRFPEGRDFMISAAILIAILFFVLGYLVHEAFGYA
jgi:hypothetical protein